MRNSIWLGTAAALVMMSGAASAADLTVAEPVDYVKVCDAFGAGFYYSPGTDTCIKVGGYVKFGTNANGNGTKFSVDGLGSFSNNETHWGSFYTEASIQLTASSVTEYGNLTGWIDLRARTGSSYDYAANGDADGHIDSAYLELGPLKAGHFTSAFDFLGGYTDFGAFRADQSTDHIQLTYALGSFGIIGSIEDGSDRDGSATYFFPTVQSGESSPSPDLVAALTYASGPINAKLSGAYVNAGSYAYDEESLKDGWAVQLGVEVALDNISKGDKFGIQGVYADNAPSYTGLQKFFDSVGLTQVLSGSVYGGFASYQHYWNPALWSAAEVSYLHRDDADGFVGGNVWQVSASTDWAIVKNLDLMLDGSYARLDSNDIPLGDTNGKLSLDQWSANVWLKRSW